VERNRDTSTRGSLVVFKAGAPTEGGKMRRVIAVLGFLMVALSWSAMPPETHGAWSNKVEVRKVEYGLKLGSPGIAIRVTLQSGEAVEYRNEDPVEAAALMRMADLFVAGRVRMFAEVEGTTLRGLQVAGSGPQARTFTP
jgi:hypothetical protein